MCSLNCFRTIKLGFDAELIDYIDHLDDLIVLEKIAPLYKDGGRSPVDPRVCFRMHDLYFTRPKVSAELFYTILFDLIALVRWMQK